MYKGMMEGIGEAMQWAIVTLIMGIAMLLVFNVVI